MGWWRPLSPWYLWGSHPLRTLEFRRLPAVLYGSEGGENLILHNTRISEVTCRPVWEWEQWWPPSPWSLWGSHPLRTRGSQMLPAVLYGGKSGGGLHLCDLCKVLILREISDLSGYLLSCMEVRDCLRLRDLYEDLILCKHADIRGYLPSCRGGKSGDGLVSVISVWISSFENMQISGFTCRPVWGWERWRPRSLWSLWGSHPRRTRGSQNPPSQRSTRSFRPVGIVKISLVY